MSDFDSATWPSDRTVLVMVARSELEWGSHEKALTRVARQLDWKIARVMEACDRAINPPDGMGAPSVAALDVAVKPDAPESEEP